MGEGILNGCSGIVAVGWDAGIDIVYELLVKEVFCLMNGRVNCF